MGKRDHCVAIGCALLTLFAGATCQAKKIAESAPKLWVGWALAPNLAFVRLAITNQGDRSVVVDPQMGFLLPEIANDPRILPSVLGGSEAGEVQAILTAVDHNGLSCSWEIMLARPQRYPVIVASGKTRKIKVPVEGYAMNRTGRPGNPDRIAFSLRWKEKELASYVFVRQGRLWKQWRFEMQ